MPIRYLNQCGFFVNWTLGNKVQWNCLFEKIHFKMSSTKLPQTKFIIVAKSSMIMAFIFLSPEIYVWWDLVPHCFLTMKDISSKTLYTGPSFYLREKLTSTLGPEWNGQNFPCRMFKWIFVHCNFWILNKISLAYITEAELSIYASVS